MEEKNINPAESLDIINHMINTAKNKLADDGFLLITWGWLIFSAAMIHYLTILAQIPYGEYMWCISIPLGIIVSIIYGLRQNKKENVKTYLDSYLGYSWSAFIISMVITLTFMQVNGIKSTYFFLMLLYGMATFISGGLLNFKPLIVGSIFSFVFAVIALFAPERELLLCISASLLCSYIIPGHLLQAKYKSHSHV